MAAVLEALNVLTAIVLNVLGILGIVQNNTARSAQEIAPYTIQNQGTEALDLLNDGSFGLAAIATAIATLTTNLATDTTSVLTAVGTPQQTGSPVTLPAVPPSTFSDAIANDTAAAVWSYLLPATSADAADSLANVSTWVLQQSAWSQLPSQFDRNFAGYTEWWNELVPTLHPDNVAPDYLDVRLSDTVLTWLTRTTDPGWGWAINPLSGLCEANSLANPSAGLTVVCLLTDADIAVYAEALSSSGVVPPCWPGLANVTIGAPVVLADGITIPGPLDGLIISITATPYPIGYYPFGAHKSYVKVGAVCFVSDNGDLEHPQPIGLDAQVMSPKTMVRSSSAVVRLQSGVTGTITPWVQN